MTEAARSASSYDAFAECYARWWGPQCADRFLPALDRLLLADLRPGAVVLDLCCGSGDLAARLVARGLEVTGVDGSERLLEFARRRAPAARFVCADARKFVLGGRHDAAFCAFDSLNHMAGPEDLEAAFAHVLAALRPGGLFACDLNCEAAYLHAWDDSYGHAEADLACVVTLGYDRAERVGTFEAAVFRAQVDGRWCRSDVRLRQSAYEPVVVAAALERAGFAEVTITDASVLPGLRESVGRVAYVARRPAEGQA